MRLSDDLLERLALHYEAFEPDKETAAALRELQLARRVVDAARLSLPLLRAPTAADAGEFLTEAQRMASALRRYDEAER